MARWETSYGECYFWLKILELCSIQMDHTTAWTQESQVFRYTPGIDDIRESSHNSRKKVGKEGRAKLDTIGA